VKRSSNANRRWTDLEFAEGRGQGASERIGARTGQQQGEGEKEFGEGKFVAALIDVEAMRQVDQEDGAEHDGHRADCPDSKESAGENGEASNELSQADQIADGYWRVDVRGKVQWPRTAEDAKKNAAAVIEKR
jgi:hypothetical protein